MKISSSIAVPGSKCTLFGVKKEQDLPKKEQPINVRVLEQDDIVMLLSTCMYCT